MGYKILNKYINNTLKHVFCENPHWHNAFPGPLSIDYNHSWGPNTNYYPNQNLYSSLTWILEDQLECPHVL